MGSLTRGVFSTHYCDPVYAVEASDLADLVREVVVQNKAADRIIVVKAKVEEVQLPEAVDIVLSEWMGYALLYVCMLYHLAPLTVAIRSRCSIA